MGCICSKGTDAIEDEAANELEKEKSLTKSSVQLAPSKRGEILVGIVSFANSDFTHTITNPVLQVRMDSKHGTKYEEQKTKTVAITSMQHGMKGEQIAAGWPQWLTSVAGEAIHGWVPRSADSFEKLHKIGQGTYSSVYKARDLKTGKIVALKKVRFMNMDPESVRFMAREIHILRKLDHPNVMKLEALVTSRMSGSLYLVFEYMEHDLSGLAASPNIKFTEPQIKCYVQQLLRGLEHCHSRGILHRDIKGANLLIDKHGVLKIGDFGLANFFHPDQRQPLTSRVVTLWYRAPELLLGATEYGVAIDLWSVGCILAELFAGKPIMPGRTEVEQMHKIFKLCGSPSEGYWRRSKLPHSASFKPQRPYRRCLSEIFKSFPSSALSLIDVLLSIEPEQRGTASSALNSEFFSTKPLPCDLSSLPKYPPSKEFDAKLREEDARRRKAEAVKGCGPESVRIGTRESKEVPAEEPSTLKSVKHDQHKDGRSGFPIDPSRGIDKHEISRLTSMVHPSAVGYSSTRKEDGDHIAPGRTMGSAGNGPKMRRQTSHGPRCHVRSTSGIHYSGPLMPPSGNMEEMLKEHERFIQEAVRKARLEKARTKKDHCNYG
ncbi:Cyclin-dependent kinase [Bertholletia excelsa]